MAESMKVLGNVWKNYLSLKSTLNTSHHNQKTLDLLGPLKSMGNYKSPQDIVALSAQASKSQASEEDGSLSAEDAEKKQNLEALDQTLQQLKESWKNNKKADLKRRVTQAKEQLRVLRMMAQMAVASGDKAKAKAIARQVADIARGIAQAAKDIGKSNASPADDSNSGNGIVSATTTTITIAGPATEQVAVDMGEAQAVAKDGGIVTATVQSATTGNQAEKQEAAAIATDDAATAHDEHSSMKELFREARNRIEDAKNIVKFLSRMATNEQERQDYKKLDDKMKNFLADLHYPNSGPPSAQVDAVSVGADADGLSFAAQATTESGVSITISVTETTAPAEAPVNLTA